MGTRAMIKFDGKPFVATHLDGYPEDLGKQLVNLEDKSKENVLSVAQKHGVDFADKSVQKALNKKRVEKLAKKHDLPEEKIKQGIRRGGIITHDDYQIDPIDDYNDWAEWEYDIRDGKVMMRALWGSYDENPTKGEWVQMPKTENEIEQMTQTQQNKVYLKKMEEMPEKYVEDELKRFGASDKLDADQKQLLQMMAKSPKLMSYKGKGWHGENLAHRLARMGFKVKPIKNDMGKLRRLNRRVS